MSEIVLKTIQHGELVIHNVPHNLYPRGIGPDGKKEYIDGPVMYRLTVMFQKMIEQNTLECDYEEFN